MGLKRFHVKVSGRVQGVFFRSCSWEEAQKLCLTGWVRNEPDFTVEAEIQGDEPDVNRMLAWLHRGSPGSDVKAVVVNQQEVIAEDREFKIKY